MIEKSLVPQLIFGFLRFIGAKIILNAGRLSNGRGFSLFSFLFEDKQISKIIKLLNVMQSTIQCNMESVYYQQYF